jgi:hypothetical protein
MKMANINIIIPDEVHRDLKIRAIKEEKSLKDLIIELLSE